MGGGGGGGRGGGGGGGGELCPAGWMKDEDCAWARGATASISRMMTHGMSVRAELHCECICARQRRFMLMCCDVSISAQLMLEGGCWCCMLRLIL